MTKRLLDQRINSDYSNIKKVQAKSLLPKAIISL